MAGEWRERLAAEKEAEETERLSRERRHEIWHAQQTHRFGPVTTARLGLEGKGKEWGGGQYKDWFGKLRGYSAYLSNFPEWQRQTPHWVRGAQLDIQPQDYLDAQKVILANLQAGLPVSELSPKEQYLFGLSDVAPEGFTSVPAGIQPTMARFPAGGVEGEAQRWFKEQYPSISGGERGGAAPRQGWRDIFTGSGRFAPRVRTITY